MWPARCEFVSGAVVSIAMSFDVPKHRHRPIELYGTEARHDRARPQLFRRRHRARRAPATTGSRCRPSTPIADGNYRIIGVADMAQAIRANRPHRASGDLAFHVLEVMEAFQRSSDTGAHITSTAGPSVRPLPTAWIAGYLA